MTTNGTLMNHCGASLVTKGDLEIIPAPPPTETWFPIPHLDVLEAVEGTLSSAGFEVRNYQLSVSHGKLRFFGVLDIATPLADGVTLSVGVRNSNDKSFPIGFCVGNRTFVCDNLAFSSEIVISKRHTRFGSDRFHEGIAATIDKLSDYHSLEAERIKRLQSQAIPDRAAESIVLRAWEQGLVGTRLLRPLLDEWRKPTFEEFQDRTAWSMLAAFTHVAKDRQRPPENRSYELNQ
ncbi:hypothetical protein H6770_01060 [Candidatus Peribacteria bacterium]|nr:hypothetical protein [Candidatus Peribacteria bacterium]